MKLNLKNITAITYDGRELNDKLKHRYKCIYNLMQSNIEFKEIKFYLTQKINNLPTTTISTNNINHYNNWCIYELHKHFNTEYVLIFQNDGFALNPQNWTDEFYNYDYIGAPWPDYLGWTNHTNKVGNGGFSLRSKKLCEYTPNLPHDTTNEDTKICSKYRHLINQQNLKIAPIEIARKFSVENPLDPEHNLTTTFGYHGPQHEPTIQTMLNTQQTNNNDEQHNHSE